MLLCNVARYCLIEKFDARNTLIAIYSDSYDVWCIIYHFGVVPIQPIQYRIILPSSLELTTANMMSLSTPVTLYSYTLTHILYLAMHGYSFLALTLLFLFIR